MVVVRLTRHSGWKWSDISKGNGIRSGGSGRVEAGLEAVQRFGTDCLVLEAIPIGGNYVAEASPCK